MWKQSVTTSFLILSREICDRELFHTKKNYNFNSDRQIYYEKQLKDAVLYNDTWEADSRSAGQDIPRLSSNLQFHYLIEKRMRLGLN